MMQPYKEMQKIGKEKMDGKDRNELKLDVKKHRRKKGKRKEGRRCRQTDATDAEENKEEKQTTAKIKVMEKGE